MSKNLYACAMCQESFADAKTLVNHVENKHQPIQTIKEEAVHSMLREF